jgi:DNA-binding GntR family transcriptional regulator
MAISKAARNKYFDFLYARLLDDGKRMLYLYFNSFFEGVPDSVADEHDLIIEAIENKDADWAETLAKEHAIDVAARFLNYLNDRHTTEFDIRVKPHDGQS